MELSGRLPFLVLQVKRASKIGVSWEGLVDDLKRNFEEVEKEYEAVNRERVREP